MAEPSTVLFTIFGLILFGIGSDALLAGVIVASVFQAMAFANFGGSPLIVYYFFGLLFIVRNLLDITWQPKMIRWTRGSNGPAAWLALFTALSLVGAFALPQAFDGAMVYSPKLSIDEQYNNLTRLVLGSSHFNQAMQLAVNALIFFLLWLRGVRAEVALRALFVALGVSIFFAVWQLLANASGIYFPEDWLYTVEGWSIGNHQVVGSFLRVNGTFLEPSTFSTYLVGVFAFLLILWVKRPSWVVLLGVLSVMFCMVITTSTTAYVGLLLVVLAVLLGFATVQVLKDGWIDKSLFGMLVAILLFTWLASIVVVGSNDVRDLLDLVLTQKSDGDSFRFRLEADVQSLEVLARTYGFGLGLGSNRPSSFLAFLVSNVGALGLLAFIMFTVSLSRNAMKKAKASPEPETATMVLATVWALWVTLMAKVFAQPDLTFAPLWVWLFLLAAFCTQQPRSLDRT